MIRLATTLVAALAIATPAAAQFNIFSPAPLAGEDWVGVKATKTNARLTAEPAARAARPAPAAPAPAPAAAPIAEAAPKGPRLSALSSPAQAEQPAAGPALKREVIVTGELVRIGDLVENAGAVAEVAIFRAPDLGQTGGVSARRIAEAVRAHQIIGLDTRGIEEVAVTRASRAVTVKEIEARILRALAGQHGIADAKDLGIAFDHEVRTFYVEPDATAELALARLNYDPRSRRLDAAIELPGTAARRAPLRLTGVLTETFEAMVPVRALAQGETVKPSDLTIERRPKSELTPTTLTTAAQAVGLAAKRALPAGKVIRQGDLIKPELVGRNESVTIVFEAPGIVLTVRGKALEAGAQGDLINVLNVQSKRTVQATVIGPGRVTVSATSPRVAANTDPSNPPHKRAE
jgi:flagella basal body P-ring formation protein FlgA